MLFYIAVSYFTIINLVACGVFGVDKHRAVKGKWRIPERTLFLLAAAGGAVGALLGMFLFHHKTQKPKFTIGMPLLLAGQCLAAVLLYCSLAA